MIAYGVFDRQRDFVKTRVVTDKRFLKADIPGVMRSRQLQRGTAHFGGQYHVISRKSREKTNP